MLPAYSVLVLDPVAALQSDSPNKFTRQAANALAYGRMGYLNPLYRSVTAVLQCMTMCAGSAGGHALPSGSIL